MMCSRLPTTYLVRAGLSKKPRPERNVLDMPTYSREVNDKLSQVTVKTMNTEQKPMYEWNTINWKKVEIEVFKLQKRIYQASNQGDENKVHKLQKLLLKSRAAKLLAVRKVTQDNQGKKTAGVDGIKSLSPNQRTQLVEDLNLKGKVKPVLRVLIPKPGSREKRPLGIPVMFDRATQALVKLGLEPEWEAKFEPNSFGFRPARAAHDAIEAIFSNIRLKPKYVLDADIEKCFDRVDHKKLLENLATFPLLTRVIKAWLKAGVMQECNLVETKAGTPQGGVISPLLANIALHGMETFINGLFPTNGWDKQAKSRRYQGKAELVRYADDFVVFHEDQHIIEQCRKHLELWLAERGLTMKASKTKTCHTLLKDEQGNTGFDFLGMEIRQFPVGKTHTGKNTHGEALGFKTIIKPSKSAQKRHTEAVGELIKRHQATPQEALIVHLNPVIKGWSNYYSTVVSKEVFYEMDRRMYYQLSSWASHRHSAKSKHWIKCKYWRLEQGGWNFGTREGLNLLKHGDTKITRHTKIQGTRSPYDGDWAYWSTRLGRYPMQTKSRAFLLKKQKGKCNFCDLLFRQEDLLEIDHIIPKHNGGKDKKINLQLLHRHCHDTKTTLDNKE